MDRQLIKTLIDAFAASDLSELEYTCAGATLRLVKGAEAGAGASSRTVAAAPPHPQPPAAATVQAGPAAAQGPQAAIVTAPSYGIVHLQRSPDALPLVAVGDVVGAGQVLCLIEAMKVFTELRAEHGGTVAAVLVETGQEVDVGQPLFRWA